MGDVFKVTCQCNSGWTNVGDQKDCSCSTDPKHTEVIILIIVIVIITITVIMVFIVINVTNLINVINVVIVIGVKNSNEYQMAKKTVPLIRIITTRIIIFFQSSTTTR